MKQCPKCSRTYTDDTLVYCLDDGSALVAGYDPQATLIVPAPRVTDAPAVPAFPSSTPTYIQPKRGKSWPIFALVALVLLVLLGGVVTVLIFGYSRMSTSSSTDSNEKAEKQKVPSSASPSESATPTASSLVGTWQTEVFENGERTEITVTFRADGSSNYAFKYSDGKEATDYGTWQYSDGTLFEKFSNGASGKGSIKWIDQDNIELTIIDNGVPAYTGLKRRYRRVT